MATNPFRFYFGPIDGSSVTDEIEFASVSWTPMLNAAGTWTAELLPGEPRLDLLLNEWETCVYVCHNPTQTVRFCGVVEKPHWDAGHWVLEGPELLAYGDHVFLHDDQPDTGVDQLLLLEGLIAQMPDLRATPRFHGTPAALVRDLTWTADQMVSVLSQLQKLAAMDLAFDFALGFAWAQGNIERFFDVWFPHRGSLLPRDWEHGKAISIANVTRDGSQRARTVYAVGRDPNGGSLIESAVGPLVGGPNLEFILPQKDTNDALSLEASAIAASERNAVTHLTLTGTVDVTHPDAAFGDWDIGDMFRLFAHDVDLDIEAGEYRLTAATFTVADSGALVVDQVTLLEQILPGLPIFKPDGFRDLKGLGRRVRALELDWGAAGLALEVTPVRTTDVQALANEYIPVDTSTAQVTITLPAAPIENALVGVELINGINPCAIAPSGGDFFIEGSSQPLLLSTPGQSTLLIYGKGVWYQITGAAQGMALDVVPTVSGDLVATPGTYVPVDSSAGTVTVQLPPTPPPNTLVGTEVVAGTSGVSLVPGGADQFVGGSSDPIGLGAVGDGALFIYGAAAGTWYQIGGDLAGGSGSALLPPLFERAPYGLEISPHITQSGAPPAGSQFGTMLNLIADQTIDFGGNTSAKVPLSFGYPRAWNNLEGRVTYLQENFLNGAPPSFQTAILYQNYSPSTTAHGGVPDISVFTGSQSLRVTSTVPGGPGGDFQPAGQLQVATASGVTTGTVIQVPAATADVTGVADATEQLQAWIAANVPDGAGLTAPTVVEFPAGAIYLIEGGHNGGIVVSGKTDVVFDGQASVTFKQKTKLPYSIAANPDNPGEHPSGDWDVVYTPAAPGHPQVIETWTTQAIAQAHADGLNRTRSFFTIVNGTHVKFTNMTLQGCNPTVFHGSGGYDPTVEAQDGFAFQGCTDCELDTVTVEHCWGNGAEHQDATVGLWIHDCNFHDFGRQSISFTYGGNLIVERTTLGNAARSLVDCEPGGNAVAPGMTTAVQDCHILDCTIGQHGLEMMGLHCGVSRVHVANCTGSLGNGSVMGAEQVIFENNLDNDPSEASGYAFRFARFAAADSLNTWGHDFGGRQIIVANNTIIAHTAGVDFNTAGTGGPCDNYSASGNVVNDTNGSGRPQVAAGETNPSNFTTFTLPVPAHALRDIAPVSSSGGAVLAYTGTDGTHFLNVSVVSGTGGIADKAAIVGLNPNGTPHVVPGQGFLNVPLVYATVPTGFPVKGIDFGASDAPGITNAWSLAFWDGPVFSPDPPAGLGGLGLLQNIQQVSYVAKGYYLPGTHGSRRIGVLIDDINGAASALTTSIDTVADVTALPSTINVVTTLAQVPLRLPAFPASGVCTVRIADGSNPSAAVATFRYTSKTATAFEGCTLISGTGGFAPGDTIAAVGIIDEQIGLVVGRLLDDGISVDPLTAASNNIGILNSSSLFQNGASLFNGDITVGSALFATTPKIDVSNATAVVPGGPFLFANGVDSLANPAAFGAAPFVGYGFQPTFLLARSNGTGPDLTTHTALPSPVGTGDILGQVGFGGQYDTTPGHRALSAMIYAQADEDFGGLDGTATDYGTRLIFAAARVGQAAQNLAGPQSVFEIDPGTGSQAGTLVGPDGGRLQIGSFVSALANWPQPLISLAHEFIGGLHSVQAYLGLNFIATTFNGANPGYTATLDTRTSRGAADPAQSPYVDGITHAPMVSGDLLGGWHIGGDDGVRLVDAAQVFCRASEAWLAGTSGSTHAPAGVLGVTASLPHTTTSAATGSVAWADNADRFGPLLGYPTGVQVGWVEGNTSHGPATVPAQQGVWDWIENPIKGGYPDTNPDPFNPVGKINNNSQTANIVAGSVNFLNEWAKATVATESSLHVDPAVDSTGGNYRVVWGFDFFPASLWVPYSSTNASVVLTRNSLASGAASSYDTHWATLAHHFAAAGFTTVHIAFKEFNQTLESAFNDALTPAGTGTAADARLHFIQYWRSIVAAMRKAEPGVAFKFEWVILPSSDLTSATWGQNPASIYPGDDVVDYVGFDFYDRFAWSELLAETSHGGFGLNWLAGFAAHTSSGHSVPVGGSKPIVFGEWGESGGHDDPTFIVNVAAWFTANNVDHAIYFDENPNALSPGFNSGGVSYPNSLTQMQSSFAATPSGGGGYANLNSGTQWEVWVTPNATGQNKVLAMLVGNDQTLTQYSSNVSNPFYPPLSQVRDAGFAVVNGGTIGGLVVGGAADSVHTLAVGAYMAAQATENWAASGPGTPTHTGTKWIWATTKTGTPTAAVNMTLDDSGNLTVVGNVNAAGFNLGVGGGAWTNYTPAAVQQNTLVLSVTYARYVQVGKTVTCQGRLQVSSTLPHGVSGQAIEVSLPVTAQAVGATQPIVMGVGVIDHGATEYKCTILLDTNNNRMLFRLDSDQTTGNLGVTPTFALGTGDGIRWSVTYEAA